MIPGMYYPLDDSSVLQNKTKKSNASFFPQGGVRVAYTEEMAQFGDSQGADAGAVDRWLVASGTLEFDPPNPNALRTGGVGAVAGGGLGDDDEAEGGQEDAVARYDCGLESCRKSFKHSHFLAAGDAGLPQGFHERL